MVLCAGRLRLPGWPGLHNDANVCCIPARFIPYDEAQDIVERFLTTEFEGGRHQRRIEKIPVKK